MVLDELELLYLRRVVVERISSLDRNLQRNLRYFGNSDDEVLKQRRIGNLEAELKVMNMIREKVNLDIAYKSIFELNS